ncbi:MAG: peptide deformylase, partial [Pseudomonadota bacterium]
MTVRPCLPWPHKCLRSPAEQVTEITDDIRAIWTDMIDTMEAMPGIGLAAPQIGIGLRLAVVDASRERGKAVLMANPEVLHASLESALGEEGSPNLPGVSAKVKRPRAVTVRYLNEAGIWDRREFVLQWGRSVQHQIDHLNGRMY